MKNLILVVLAVISMNVSAWHIENFAALSPDFLVKGNLGTDSEGLTSSITIALETKMCNRYVHCFNPFLVNINNRNGSNTGIGMDYVYKMNKSRNYAEPYDVPGNSVFLMFGGALFHEPLNNVNGTYGNFHAGIGVEVDRVIFSLDAYGSPWSSRDEAESEILVNIGYRF